MKTPSLNYYFVLNILFLLHSNNSYNYPLFNTKNTHNDPTMLASVYSSSASSVSNIENTLNLDPLPDLRQVSEFAPLFIFHFFLICSLIGLRYFQKTILRIKDEEKYFLLDCLHKIKKKQDAIKISIDKRDAQLKTIHTHLYTAISQNNAESLKNITKELETVLSQDQTQDLLIDDFEYEQLPLATLIKSNYPDLSDNDIKHCVLINAGFSLKATAKTLNVSISAVKNARNRIKRKMNLSQNKTLKCEITEIAKKQLEITQSL